MNINNAILHVFDFVSCVNVFAQAPMDLGNKAAKRYVTSQAKRALGNLDSKRGTFAENSLFAEELRAYFRGERDFVGLSQQIGEFIVGELSRMEKTPSTDLLVVDFEGDADQTVREMTDEEAEAANEAKEIIASLRAHYGEKIRVFGTEIPFSVRAAETSGRGKSIFSHDKNGKVAAAYRSLTKEVLEFERKTERFRDDAAR